MLFSICGGLVLHDTGGDPRRSAARPPRCSTTSSTGSSPTTGPASAGSSEPTSLSGPVSVHLLALRVSDAAGRVAGTVLLTKPPIGMSTVSTMLYELDLDHLEQMQRMSGAARRPAAILFADLEGSSSLARRLSTHSYFALGRRLISAADRCVIDAGGLVGRHVGDGVVAFFLMETLGSESAAARACITASRALRAAVDGVAARSDVDPERSSSASGSTGAPRSTWAASTPAAAARWRPSATRSTRALGSRRAPPEGGRSRRRTSSSGSIRRMPPPSASIPITSPTPRSRDLETATEKARRDAPAIPVCDV